MKLIRIITAMVLTITLLVVSVGADEFVASVGLKDSPRFYVQMDENGREYVGEIYDENGNFVSYMYLDELIITPYFYTEMEQYDIPEEVEKVLIAAWEELSVAGWTDLVAGFAEAWQAVTGGAPVSNAVIAEIFDVRYRSGLTGELYEGRRAVFFIEVDGITSEDLFVIGHKPSTTGQWGIEEYTIDGNNVIGISVNALSPFFIAVDNGEAPAVSGDAPSSPQTGVYETGIGAAVIAAGILGVCAVFFGRKSRKVSAQ